MLIFPTIVYRMPGSWAGPPVNGQSTSFATKAINTQDELDAALFAGWFLTVPEAVDPSKRAPVAPSAAEEAKEAAEADVPVAVVTEVDDKPSRAMLEAQAKDVGVKVDGRWSDARLAAEIAKAKG